MKTKTEKTPHVMAEAYGLTYCPSALVPESKLSHRSKAQYCFILKLSHHSGKNTVPLRFTEKLCPLEYCRLESLLPTSGTFFSAKRGVFSELMSCVPQERVLRAGLVQELALKHGDLNSARKVEDLRHQRSVFYVFV